jgi:hypothetical protein
LLSTTVHLFLSVVHFPDFFLTGECSDVHLELYQSNDVSMLDSSAHIVSAMVQCSLFQDQGTV